MITVKEKIRLIEACFGKSKLSNDNKNIVVFCPVCKSQGKDKFKLAIGVDKGMYHCWVCGIKGRNIIKIARMVDPGASNNPVFVNWSKSAKRIEDSSQNDEITDKNLAMLLLVRVQMDG